MISKHTATVMSNNQMSVAEETLRREFQQEVLNRMRQYLCNHLEPERFFPYLQTKNYLDTESCDQIRNAGTTKSKVNKMLDILMRSGRQPLFALVRAIEKSGSTQKFVADRIKDEHANWIKRSENRVRLESLQRRNGDYPTTPYDPASCHNPPPYSAFSFIQPPSVPLSYFHLPPSGWDVPKTGPKSVGSPVFTPPSYDHSTSPNMRSRSPCDPSYIPSYGPSHFHTSDFPESTNIPDTLTQIQHDQIKAESKIPPPLDGISASLDETIFHSQSKEFQRYELPNPDLSTNNWPRSPRTPSEHEVSSQERTNGIPTINPKNTEDLKSVSDTEDVRLGALKSQVSCQPSSIQPSTFVYSNDENDAFGKYKNSEPLFKERRNVANGTRTNLLAKDYSSTLETITSGELLTKNFTSLPPIPGTLNSRSPTEHADASVRSANYADDIDYESTLEISTASLTSIRLTDH